MSKVVYLSGIHVNRVLSPLNCFGFFFFFLHTHKPFQGVFIIYLKPGGIETSCTALVFFAFP